MSDDKKTYELCYLVISPDAEEGVLKVVKQHEGEITHKSELKEMQLAYQINKMQSAHFGFVQFTMMSENVQKLTSALQLNDKVLRFLTVIMKPKTSSPPQRTFSRPQEPTIMKKTMPEQKREEKVPASQEGVLSNEALEKKLEEILK